MLDDIIEVERNCNVYLQLDRHDDRDHDLCFEAQCGRGPSFKIAENGLRAVQSGDQAVTTI